MHAIAPRTGTVETLFSHRGETLDARRPGTSRILFTTRAIPGLWVHDQDTGDPERFATLSGPPSLLTLTDGGAS